MPETFPRPSGLGGPNSRAIGLLREEIERWLKAGPRAYADVVCAPRREATLRRRAKQAVTRHDSYSRPASQSPWCLSLSHSHGRYPQVLPRAEAKRCRYIQSQAPRICVWLIFDYDHSGGWCVADEVRLLTPTVTVINSENGMGTWLLGSLAPSRLGPENRDKPKRYLAAVERARVCR